MEVKTFQQLCIACNRVQQSPAKKTCECGHVLKDALMRANARKRRAPIRPDSISSEWIDDGAIISKVPQKKRIVIEEKRKKQFLLNVPHIRKKPRARLSMQQQLKRSRIRKPPLAIQNSTITDNSGVDGNNNGRNDISNDNKNENRNIPSSKVNNKTLSSKSDKLKELLTLIQSSYKNVYFNRCKSYKRPTADNIDFEFDFSTFESGCPYYPKPLEDINAKINRMNGIWKQL